MLEVWRSLARVKTSPCMVSRNGSICNARLHRLMCYIHSPLDKVQVGWVGDTVADFSPHLYWAAEFLGCPFSARDTTSVALLLEGPSTRFPSSFASRRHDAVSHSTLGADILAACQVLWVFSIPVLMLWDVVRGSVATPSPREDNTATMCICEW